MWLIEGGMKTEEEGVSASGVRSSKAWKSSILVGEELITDQDIEVRLVSLSSISGCMDRCRTRT